MNYFSLRRSRVLTVVALIALFAIALAVTLSQRPQEAGEAQAAVALGGGDYHLLARLVFGEASNEPLEGQVAVASVILNRVRDPRFPNTLGGVVYEPHAFELVTNGQIWSDNPTPTNYEAARLAINGWDPTYGCTFFWNPSKPVTPWIWSRPLVTQIGNHVFAR